MAVYFAGPESKVEGKVGTTRVAGIKGRRCSLAAHQGLNSQWAEPSGSISTWHQKRAISTSRRGWVTSGLVSPPPVPCCLCCRGRWEMEFYFFTYTNTFGVCVCV